MDFEGKVTTIISAGLRSVLHGSATIRCPSADIVDEVSVFVLRIIYDDFVLLRTEWISLFFVVISVVTLRILLMNDIEF